jgi:hypothetical protein
MERMEHIRGRVFHGETVVLDEIDGYLACHERKGRKSYYGYFEMPTVQLRVLAHNECYRLVLADGRKADIYTEVVPSNLPEQSIAEFHVSGGIKK